MSLLGKKWILPHESVEHLWDRQLDDESVAFHDPFLFRDMAKAVERVGQAIENQERIVIFGDYDVDGISGTALLVHTLRALGAHVSYRLPNRQEGYGLNLNWIEEFKKIGAQLVITVDCGISNAKEIQVAREHGIETIVTDHHTLPVIFPEAAHSILHPQLPQEYPFRELSGSGVAYKLAVALWKTFAGEELAEEWQTRLVDLASLGTVADCVLLKGENRWIVKNGIEQMKQTHWEGLKLLLKSAGIEEIQGCDTETIGFRIGPRLNAAGRLDTPYYALQLLLNENNNAPQFVQKLEFLNTHRQTIMEKAIEQAENRLKENGGLTKKILIAWDSKWSAGILGLIAARLSEKHHRPTIILEDRGEALVASCRSPEYFNIVEALQASGHRFETYGGHAAAAGFKIRKDQLEGFAQEIEAYAKCIPEEAMAPILKIDHPLTLEELNFDLVDRLTTLEPYGQGNAKPLFLLKNVRPSDLQIVGRDHRHLKFSIAKKDQTISAIAFKFGEHFPKLQSAYTSESPVHVVFEFGKSTWNGKERLEMRVVDIGLEAEV